MFSAHCSSHGGQVLLGERRIRRLDNTDAGIVVTYECWCGTVGRFVAGRRRRETPAGGVPERTVPDGRVRRDPAA